MGIGKYISLEEARRKKKLDRFIKAHPSTGSAAKFDKLFKRMAKSPSTGGRTSK